MASDWRLDPTGPTWVLTLDAEARFSDGTPVTAADVLAAWGEPGRGAALQPWVRRFVRSMVAVDGRVIGVTLHDPDRAESLRALANPALAIARRQPGAAWPLGTTGFRVTDQPVAEVAAVTLARHTWGRGDLAVAERGQVRFLAAPDADLRDQLDQATTPGPPVDLLVTRDPAVLSYATVLPAFRVTPLEWLRTHALLSPAREPPRGSGADVIALEARQALAMDAVRGEARGATGPFWWQLPTDCAAAVPYRRSRPVSGAVYAKRVVFPEDDPVASRPRWWPSLRSATPSWSHSREDCFLWARRAWSPSG
ncbi:MAG: ABC transporter substrate-binding protein [Acidobacteria bacterium]|nr:ABC transporter substrate-binding protein [Acidobacteriota bacterium]